MKYIFLSLAILSLTSCASSEWKARYKLYVNCCTKQNGEFCKKVYSSLIGNDVYPTMALSQCCSSGICKYK